MPPVVAAVVAIAQAITVKAIIAFVVKTVVSMVVSMAITAAFSKKPKSQSSSFSNYAQDRTLSVRQPAAARRVVYGQIKVGGVMVFLHTTSNDTQLHIIQTLAGHEVEEIGDIYLNDELVPLDGSGNATGRYAGYVRVIKHLGSPTQTADATLVAEAPDKWTTAHRLQGIAYIYVRLTGSNDLFPNGVPNFSAIVKGKNDIYDPRTATTGWTANAALCIANYLSSTKYGVSATYATHIDATALTAAANVCDEAVALAAGGTEARYTLNGSFDSGQAPEDVVGEMNTAMHGKVVYSGGRWSVIAGAYSVPTVTLDEDDARGAVKVVPRISRRDLFNAVKGVYTSPANQWQPSDFPAVTNPTYEAQDNDERIWRDIGLPYTTSGATAQRIAKIELEKSRQQIVVNFPAKLTGLKLRAGDTCKLSLARFGWTEKVFEVLNWRFEVYKDAQGEDALGIDLTLRETASADYDWNSGNETLIDPAPDTNLPNPFTVGAVAGLACASGTDHLLRLGDGTVMSRIYASWTALASGLVYGYEVEFKKSTETVYTPAGTVISGSSTYLAPVEDGTSYTVRVRAINTLGVRGAWASVSHTVIGKTALPANVASLTPSVDGPQIRLTFPKGSEADLAGCEIRDTDSGWGGAGYLWKGDATTCLVTPAAVGVAKTWYVRAFDTSGNYSPASASASYTVAAPANTTAITESFYDTSVTSATITLDWPDVAPVFGLSRYKVTYGAVVKYVNASTITLPADWLDARIFTVRTEDRLGNLSSGFSKTITKLAPGAPSGLRAQVIDNTVMLFIGAATQTTLPVSHYRLKKGATWETAEDLGRKDGLFTTINELASGTFTYWAAAVDTDDNESTPVSATVQVSAPPNFVFHDSIDSAFGGTPTNALLEGGAITLPINLTQTWAEHFTTNGWASPADQIAAGYPIYIQPTVASGTYVETFDLGTILASSQVTITATGAAVAGTPTLAYSTELSADGSTWATYDGATQVFGTNFRYVRATITVTGGGASLYRLTGLNCLVNAKLKDDAGTVACLSTDANGTIVNFSKDFIDVASIVVTAAGTAPVVANRHFQDSTLSGTYSVTANVITVNATAHNLIAGQNVRLMPSSGNAAPVTVTVATTPTANQFTAALVTANTSGNLSIYPQSMRVILTNTTTGARVSESASWAVSGY